MSWFFIALFGYLLLAFVFVLDKLILTKSLDKPVVYTFYSTIFLFAVLFVYPFGGVPLYGFDWLWAVVSGLGFGFGLWAMFIAVKKEEASHINPFIGSVITVFTFIFASTFLGESLTKFQMGGMVLLILATLLLSFFVDKHSKSALKSFLWGILSGVLFAVSHTTAKYIYDLYPFLTGFVWTRASVGLVGLVTLFSPSVWQTLKRKKSSVVKKYEDCSSAKKHAVGLIILDKILGVLGVVLIQYAIAIGSVTLVNALVGIQYAIMFVLIILFTKFAPNFFKEKFTKSEMAIETLAILLVMLGSAMFVF